MSASVSTPGNLDAGNYYLAFGDQGWFTVSGYRFNENFQRGGLLATSYGFKSVEDVEGIIRAIYLWAVTRSDRSITGLWYHIRNVRSDIPDAAMVDICDRVIYELGRAMFRTSSG